MDEKVLNVFCEYVILPALNRFLDTAIRNGYDAYLTVGGDGLPALGVDTDDGEFAISIIPYETDIEEPEEIEDGDYELLIRVYLRSSGYEAEQNIGYMIFPAELTDQEADFLKCIELMASGLWIKDVAGKTGCADPAMKYAASPRLEALADKLGEADFLHTETLYTEGEWPEFAAVCGERVFYFSYFLFTDDESWVLRIRYTDENGELHTALFPDFGALKDSEFYEKEISIFERFFV